MTDLPQLQTLLVDAAVKRRRRRRVRRVGVPAVVLAALLVAVPWVIGETREPDPEVPAVTPAPAPRVEDAFGVFREPAKHPLPNLQPGDDMRALGQSAYLLVREGQLCLVVADRYECGPAAEYLFGHKILSTVVDDRGYAVLPDGVKSVTRTWLNRTPARFAVLRNLVTFAAPVGSGALEWRAPDGSTHREKLRDITNPRMWYPRLGRPETALDRLGGYPGARLLITASDGQVDAWLVPRRDAICLVVRMRRQERSVCRTPVADTRKPLMVVMPSHPQRIVVIATQSWQQPLWVTPEAAQRAISDDAFLILEGDEARSIRYRDDRGRDVVVELPRGPVMQRGDREIAPTELPPEP